MSGYELRPIAYCRSEFPQKFGIPRQAGLVPQLESLIVFEPEYREPEALRGIEGFSHIWLIWQFSENLPEGWSPTVRPPRLGGNRRMGVFATRSPFRPNALGLSCVRLVAVEDLGSSGLALRVAGADLMDGTPIFDVKPYVPYADCIPEALSGFAPNPGEPLKVTIPPAAAAAVPPERLDALRGVLSKDPRPSYHRDEDRVYGFNFSGMEIKFTVSGGELLVTEVSRDKK